MRGCCAWRTRLVTPPIRCSGRGWIVTVVTAAFACALIGGIGAVATTRAQDVKLPSVDDHARTSPTFGRSRAIELAPLLLRDRDVSPLLRLVQNDPVGTPATPTSAIAPTQGEVIVLLGTASGRGVDARVRRLAAVRHPPLSLYPNIRVLAWNRYTFRTTPTTVTLPNGRRLSITLTQVLPNGRFVVQTVVSARTGQSGPPTTATIEAAPGEPFFFAGHSHEGGTLMIGVSVGAARRAE